VPVRSSAQVWEILCGGVTPDPRGQCQLIGLDEDEDGSLLVTGGFQGTAPFFGERATSAPFRSLVLARVSPAGQLLWKKLLGKKVPRDESANVGEHVLALGKGLFALAGFHGPSFDLGAGALPSSPGRGTAEDGFAAVLRADGAPVFAANLETLIRGAERTSPGLPLRPLGLHPDGQGGFWVLGGRTGEPLGAARVAADGQVLARVAYPAIVRFDAPGDRLELWSSQAPERLLGRFRGSSVSVARSAAVARDGALWVGDADRAAQREIHVHRLSPDGKALSILLDPNRYRYLQDRALVAAGPEGEVYVAVQSGFIRYQNILVKGRTVPDLVTTRATVQRVDPDGSVRWTRTFGPMENLVYLRGISARGGRVRVLAAHRDDLEIAPGARVAVPVTAGGSPDSAGTSIVTVVSFSGEGEVTALDTLAPQGACPTWLPHGEMTLTMGRSLTLLAAARDQDKPGECSRAFGFNGGSVIVSAP
jgi:hypothetical protein